MANRKFSSPCTVMYSPEDLNRDYDNASSFDKVHVGEYGVYYRDGFRNRFIPFSYPDRVFIRVQEVNGKMCCGTATFSYCKLVFVKEGKEFADVISEKESAMDAALEQIFRKAENIKIGYVKE